SPGGATTDLIATKALQSGQLGAYVQMRDNILPQAQTQLDELANQMSQALSNQTTSGTAVTSGAQSGYSVDVVALGQGGTLPQQSSANPNDQTVGVNFSGGMNSVVAQLNAALGTNLQFSNPSGTVLQVLDRGGS